MSSSEVGRKFTFWVVYDATSDQQFVKMDRDTGCLTMFGTEESAAAFASGLFGVGYKEVVLYSCPQPTPDVAGLVDALNAVKTVLESDDPAIADTLWVPDALETLLDHVCVALAAYHKQGGEA